MPKLLAILAYSKRDGIFISFRSHRLSFRIPETSSVANGQFAPPPGNPILHGMARGFPRFALPPPCSPTNKVIRLWVKMASRATKVEKNENKVF